MWVEIGNLYTRVLRATDDEKAWLREYLMWSDTTWVRGRPRAVKSSLFSLVEEHFPTGFVALIRQAAKDKGFKFEIGDLRVAPCVPDPAADLAWLRPYQLEAVQAVAARTRGVIKVPTGGGKTEIAVGCAKLLPCLWLFLVHRSTLLDQAAERYEARTGRLAGRIGDGLWEIPPGCTFVVATFQTLAKAKAKRDPRFLELATKVQGLLADEAHVLPAESFYRVVEALPNAYYRVGLSGTPLSRSDQRSVLTIASTGRIIYTIRPDVLIDAGVLSRPKIRMVTVAQKSTCATWQGVYGECVVRGAARNRAIVKAATESTKPCLVFVKEISHGRKLEAMLQKAGVKSEFVWGSDSTDARKGAVKRLVRGDLEVLICSVIFQEGIDIPELQSVVVGSGGRSIIATLQRIGRGMRVAKGKTEFEVWDFNDKGCGCNEETRDLDPENFHKGCQWIEKHTRIRRNAYTSEGYETVVLAGSSVQREFVLR